MDDDVAQMMRDLGNDRRDRLSAPVERNLDLRQEQMILAKTEAVRRTRVQNVSTDADAQRLRAWNDETSFEPDGVSAQLENRMSGQGHRERLNASLGRDRRYDERREMQEVRYGEERSLYLQERDVQGKGNYRATTSSAPSGRYNAVPPPANLAATPRSLPRNGPFPTSPFAQSSRAPNRKRAPSPRAAGKVRFVGGQRVVSGQSPSASALAPGVLNAAKAISATSAQSSRTDALPRPAVVETSIKPVPPTDATTYSPLSPETCKVNTQSKISSIPPKSSITPYDRLQTMLERGMAKIRARDATLRAGEAKARAEEVKMRAGDTTQRSGDTTLRANKDEGSTAAPPVNVKPTSAQGTEAPPVPGVVVIPEHEGRIMTTPMRTTESSIPMLQSNSSMSTAGVLANIGSMLFKATAANGTSPSAATASPATATPSQVPTINQTTKSTATNRGRLEVFVKTVTGHILFPLHYDLNVVIRASLAFNIHEGDISPRELVNLTERFVRDLEGRAHGLEGVVRATDGLMEETYEGAW